MTAGATPARVGLFIYRRFAVLGALAATLSGAGCVAAVGAGVGAGMLTTAALTAGCYDPVSVKVFDSVTGLEDCAASVTARDAGGAVTHFSSCFYADLPVGSWTVQAARRGYRPVTTELVVAKGRRCEPSPQSIEISLAPVDAPVAAPVPIRPRRPGEAPLTPAGLPAPGSLEVPGTVPGTTEPAPAPPPTATPTEPPLRAEPPLPEPSAQPAVAPTVAPSP